MNGKFDYARHWRQWDWTHKNPGRPHSTWPGVENYPNPDGLDCDAACAATKDDRGIIDCWNCPLVWKETLCMATGSEHFKYSCAFSEGNYEEAAKWAKTIRDLELKDA